jgi:hypothetical protein
MRRSTRASLVERLHRLPGDEFISTPIAAFTHAITIRRPRREVWPWLVQMGAGRGGWYSYDLLDNGRQPSARRIVPQLQDVKVGAIMPAMPGVTDGFTVLAFEPEHSLTVGWVPAKGKPPMMTWSFVLEEPEPEVTRLVVRARGGTDYRPPFGLPRWTARSVMRWIHFIMQSKQLLGIAERAEITERG